MRIKGVKFRLFCRFLGRISHCLDLIDDQKLSVSDGFTLVDFKNSIVDFLSILDAHDRAIWNQDIQKITIYSRIHDDYHKAAATLDSGSQVLISCGAEDRGSRLKLGLAALISIYRPHGGSIQFDAEHRKYLEPHRISIAIPPRLPSAVLRAQLLRMNGRRSEQVKDRLIKLFREHKIPDNDIAFVFFAM